MPFTKLRLFRSLKGRGLNTSDIQALIQNGYQDRELNNIGDFDLDKQLSTKKTQVYHNPTTGEVVVNNRGTKRTSLSDWSNNLQYIMGNYEDTDRMKQAEKVQKQAIDKYGKVDINVGHSQGGIITRILNKQGLTGEVINVNPATMFEKQKKNETVIRSSGDAVSSFQALNPFGNQKKKKTYTIKALSSNPITEHGESILARMGNVFVGKGLNEMKDNVLTNYELDELAEHYKIKDYHGTYIKNELPELNHGFYIINLNGESHWTVLYKYVDPNGDTQYLYFDSFGFPAPTEVEQAIYKDARRKVDVIYSPIQLQDIDHTSCGFFVIAWMRFLNRKSTDKVKLYRQFLKKFKEPTENDIVVKQLIEGKGLNKYNPFSHGTHNWGKPVHNKKDKPELEYFDNKGNQISKEEYDSRRQTNPNFGMTA